MGIFKSIKHILNKFSYQYQLPEEVLNVEETVVMHISDTPAVIYDFIFNVIDEVQPDIIIHTGDLVDNLKLENNPALINEYRTELPVLIYELEERNIETYIVPGNHDSIGFLEEQVEDLKIINKQNYINIEGERLGVAHTIKDLPNDTLINLYGHNMKRVNTGKMVKSTRKKYLNGICNIHFIILPSLKVHQISYPPGTNQARSYRNPLLQRRIGL